MEPHPRRPRHRAGPRKTAPLVALAGFALTSLMIAPVPAPAAEAGSVVAVMVDNAKVIRLPERTATVIVGNPIIADVSLQRNGIVVLTGKSFGSTNLIALDASGTMLAESFISVQGGGQSVVTVQRGLDRESYSCLPVCLPAVQLGDAQKHFAEASGQAGQRNSLATQK